jgi:ferredoxin-NADP reductase
MPAMLEGPATTGHRGAVTVVHGDRTAADHAHRTQHRKLTVVRPLTARSHIHRAMTKPDARDRAQLVVITHQSGLAPPSPASP